MTNIDLRLLDALLEQLIIIEISSNGRSLLILIHESNERKDVDNELEYFNEESEDEVQE